MPFTPTHVLAITPIAAVSRWRLSFSALAIGSMIPDLPLFVPLAPSYATTHSLPGLITACLPLGALGFVAFQAVLKRPLIALLPSAVRCRCAAIAGPSPEPSVRTVVSVAMAVTIGAATHLVWDAFTHQGRWGTLLVPCLDATALTVAGHAVPGYKVLQYGSTAVGLPFLAALAILWLTRQAAAPLDALPSVPRAVRVATVLAALGIPAAVTYQVWRGEGTSAYDRVGRSICDSGLCLMIAVLAYSLAFRALVPRCEEKARNSPGRASLPASRHTEEARQDPRPPEFRSPFPGSAT